MSLQKNSPIPLYYQLAEAIREQIRRGDLSVGAQLPSISELGKLHGISRMTAVQAIRHLVNEGVLDARQGAGTFVAEPKLTYDAHRLLSFTEEMRRHGGQASSQMLEQQIVTPNSAAAAALHLADHEHIVRIVRLRFNHQTPLILETTAFSATRFPLLATIDLNAVSLYAALAQQYGVHITRYEHVLEATVANDYERELFGIPSALGMLLHQGVSFDQDNQPVEHFKSIYRGDRFKFRFESNSTVRDQVGNITLNSRDIAADAP